MIEEECIVCEKENLSIDKELNLAQCKNCGFIWQYKINALVAYGKEYYEKYLDYPENEISERRKKYAMKWIVPDNHQILDIGYNTGAFLKKIIQSDFQAFGIEINAYAIKQTENWINILSWEDYMGNGFKFDVITFFDSFEHIKNISEVLRNLREHTNLVVIGTPDLKNKSIEELKDWRHFRPNEHLFYFNKRTLDRLMNKYSFMLLDQCYLEEPLREDILVAIYKIL